jgi:hypothetical protein
VAIGAEGVQEDERRPVADALQGEIHDGRSM